MLTIKITDIAAMPAATITGRDFHYTNICWVRTWDGTEVEMLFDEYGNPLEDRSLIGRIESFFGKRFQAMLIDEEKIYGQVL